MLVDVGEVIGMFIAVWLVLLLIVLGLFTVYSGFSTWQRKRLIQDTPTEAVAAAAAGRTQLEGRGYPIDAAATRPFSDEECLLARYRIREEVDGDDDRWETIDRGTIAPAFEIDDGTGRMRVDPNLETRFKFKPEHEDQFTVGAREETPPEVVDFIQQQSEVEVQDKDGVSGFLFSKERKYTTRWIPIGAELYVLGGAETADTGEGLVLRQDEATDEFIVSARSAPDLVETARWAAPAKMAAGLAMSAVGLYLLL